MRVRKPTSEFITVFAISLAVTALVTLLWNYFGHGTWAVDWETSLRIAVILGIIMALFKARATPRSQGS